MWTRKLLKQNGKLAFKRNYWICVAVCVIAMLLGGISGGTVDFGSGNDTTVNNDVSLDGFDSITGYPSVDNFEESLESLIASVPGYVWTVAGIAILAGTVIGIAISILVSNVVTVGCDRYFIENREHKTGVGQLFYAFRDGRYGTTVLIMFFKNLYIFLWSLLFIIPGIVKSYSYALVPYILAENTELDRSRVLKMSRDMMHGHKWEFFVLQLSFIGWNLLSALTFGILNIFYVNPYMQATFAEFYSAVKAESIQNGTVSPGELPGVSIAVEPEYQEVVVE